MEGFDNRHEWLREKEWARVMDCFEETLKLRHGGDDSDSLSGQKAWIGGKCVDSVSCRNDWRNGAGDEL